MSISRHHVMCRLHLGFPLKFLTVSTLISVDHYLDVIGLDGTQSKCDNWGSLNKAHFNMINVMQSSSKCYFLGTMLRVKFGFVDSSSL